MSKSSERTESVSSSECQDDGSKKCQKNEEKESRSGESKKKDSAGDSEVKSVVVVKYSAVEVPAMFTRLRCNTDLNLPPSNWLSNSVETYGLRPLSFTHRSAFSSFRMAHMFPDCVGEVDVVSDAENIKKLLKIPYSHGAVSMMIHRIENTLLIDEFDVHKYLLREAECQWEWFKKFFLENVMQTSSCKEKIICHRDNSRNALMQKSLVSKFLYHSLVVTDDNEPKIRKTSEGSDHVETTAPLPLTYKNDPPQLPDPSFEEESPDPSSNHKFARNVVWTFEDIQMLLGTDMPIFGGGTHPCISLRLRDMEKPINVLTGMDYWLDNLMCNVPEVIMCYHLNGIVQKYELIKTEDLPNLENSKFSPKVIRDIAQNILSFLKANATKAGHTYWLFKGKDDDVVKLYDLTSLCTDVMDEKGQTPFTVPVAMLLYRVARNMKYSSDGRRQAGTIRVLLQNCVSLLSPEKYPEIVTSAHYMLADLYIPSDINPASPDLFTPEDDVQEKDGSDEHRMDDGDKDIAIKSMSLANISEIHLDETEFQSRATPLGMDLEARCLDGLRNVLSGLKSLKFLEEKEETVRPTEEEPTMAKPFEKIPMPYQPLDENKGGKKRNRKKRKDLKQLEEPLKTLLCKGASEAIPTWHPPMSKVASCWKTHLKSLLYDKMSLIYVTLMEKSYSDKNFGLALRFAKLVLAARKVFKSVRMDLIDSDVESYLLGRAGDALFMVVQNFQNMKTFNTEYTSTSEFDEGTLEELKSEDLGECPEEEEGFPTELKNIEDLLLGSCRCYQRALGMRVVPDNENLLRRLGNVENELGVFYMNQPGAKYQQEANSDKGSIDWLKYRQLFAKSQEHLDSGVKIFESVKDEANLALLYSNKGRLMRVQAHFLSLSETDENELATQERHFYKKSISNYQKALQVLGDRKYNAAIWDSVHWELSTALFAMATLLQDFPCFSNKEKAEREVTETLHKALKYCDVDTPGSRQPIYQYRSAMIHHRLASLYHSCYRTQTDDEAKRKKIYQLCKLHYEKSIKLLLLLENSSEFLRVQLERVALAEFQAENSNSPSVKLKHYEYALDLLIEAMPVLKLITERDIKFYEGDDVKIEKREEAGTGNRKKTKKQEGEDTEEGKEEQEVDDGETKSELENELLLLGFFEQRLQFVLLSLTKLYKSRVDFKKGCANAGEVYKKLYGTTLRSDTNKSNPVELSKSLLSVVMDISEKVKSIS